jgi:hypothetical protein
MRFEYHSLLIYERRRGRVVEGTPLLRAHLGKTWIQGSNPCVSAKYQEIRHRELSKIGVTNRWNPVQQGVPSKTS